MSADDYYVIKKYGDKFAAYHCFFSDDFKSLSYPSYVNDSLEIVSVWANRRNPEYGVEILEECWD